MSKKNIAACRNCGEVRGLTGSGLCGPCMQERAVLKATHPELVPDKQEAGVAAVNDRIDELTEYIERDRLERISAASVPEYAPGYVAPADVESAVGVGEVSEKSDNGGVWTFVLTCAALIAAVVIVFLYLAKHRPDNLRALVADMQRTISPKSPVVVVAPPTEPDRVYIS